MKAVTSILFKKSILFLSCFILLQPLTASPQSGRVTPKPTPQPTRAPAESDAISNADSYKLIFVSSMKGRRAYATAKEQKEIWEDRQAYNVSFITQLNQAGGQGYQFVAAGGKGKFAIAKLGQGTFEYDWFETNSKWFFAKDGFELRFQPLSRKGFSLVDHSFLSSSCKEAPMVPHDAPIGVFNVDLDDCHYFDWFVVQRTKDAATVQEFKLLRYSTGFKSKRTRASFVKEINDNLSVGLYPTHILSKFEVLLQPSKDKYKLLMDKSEVIVITEKWQKMEQKVNEWAQQGYRLALIRHEIAVMYRQRNNASPASYIWVYTGDPNFESELARLQNMRATYRTTCPGMDGDKNALIFERLTANDAHQREYKTFKFELNETEDITRKTLTRDLTPPSKEKMKILNSLAKEGFEVKDLFDVSDVHNLKIGVLLERVR